MWAARFIGGRNIQQVVLVANRVIQQNKYPIINYAVEHTDKPTIVLNEHLKLVSQLNWKYKIAIKLSSFGFDHDIINTLIHHCAHKNIRIIIDAEEGSLNDKYQEISNYLQKQHNRYVPYVIKTYQMYRKDSLETLQRDIVDSHINSYCLGIKLVRGAYHNTEYKEGHLFTNKKDTDENYNKAILTIYKNNTNSYTMLATHNTDSIRLGYLSNIEVRKHIFEFGHLMGMRDEDFQELANKGEHVNVYIPYGPLTKMIPYLTRRLYENMDMMKYMVK